MIINFPDYIMKIRVKAIYTSIYLTTVVYMHVHWTRLDHLLRHWCSNCGILSTQLKSTNSAKCLEYFTPP